MGKKIVSDQYHQVAELVGCLIEKTKADQIIWTYRGPLSFVEMEHDGFKYTLDNPQDGQPEFLVGDVLVWRGYELRELWSAAMDQDSRYRPAVPVTAVRQLPDIRAAQAVGDALKRLKK